MTARELWSGYYWRWRNAIFDGLRPVTIKSRRGDMIRFRREAALERKLEAAEREIERLEDLIIAYKCGAEEMARRIEELEGFIDKHNKRVLEQDAVNKFLFS